MNRIDHIGLSVRDLDATSALLQTTLGYVVERGQREVVGERVELLRSDEVEYELIEHQHPIAQGRFDEGGEDCQFHHFAIEVDDLGTAISLMAAKGVKFTTPEPALSEIPGRGRRSSIFTIPTTTGGLMFQFVQYL